MTAEGDNSAAALGGLLPATGGGIRAEDVIVVPKGEVGKQRPRKAHPRDETYGLEGPLLPQNWITYATVQGPQCITCFETTWEVPQPPTFNNGQLLYLFSGLQNAAQNQILQPVLQWGKSPWGGGPFWSVFPLFVDTQAGNVEIPPIGATPVAPGTYLTGYIHLLDQAGGHFTYECGFTSAGVPGPKLMMATDMMVQAVEVLEAYGIVQPENYPAQALTTFSIPKLTIAGAPVPVLPKWEIVDRITNYHQHTTPYPDGHVDIHYGVV